MHSRAEGSAEEEKAAGVCVQICVWLLHVLHVCACNAVQTVKKVPTPIEIEIPVQVIVSVACDTAGPPCGPPKSGPLSLQRLVCCHVYRSACCLI